MFLLALPPSAASPTNDYFPEHVRFLGPWSPRPPQTTWPKNHFGVPLICLLVEFVFAVSPLRQDQQPGPTSAQNRPGTGLVKTSRGLNLVVLAN